MEPYICDIHSEGRGGAGEVVLKLVTCLRILLFLKQYIYCSFWRIGDGSQKNQKKILINIGTWNVRTLNNDGNLDLLLKNMKSLNIKILGVAETHWNNSVEDTFQQNGYVIIHSSRKDEMTRQGVAIVIEKELSKCMTSYALTLERIMSVSLKTHTGLVTIIQVYAPD